MDKPNKQNVKLTRSKERQAGPQHVPPWASGLGLLVLAVACPLQRRLPALSLPSRHSQRLLLSWPASLPSTRRPAPKAQPRPPGTTTQATLGPNLCRVTSRPIRPSRARQDLCPLDHQPSPCFPSFPSSHSATLGAFSEYSRGPETTAPWSTPLTSPRVGPASLPPHPPPPSP